MCVMLLHTSTNHSDKRPEKDFGALELRSWASVGEMLSHRCVMRQKCSLCRQIKLFIFILHFTYAFSVLITSRRTNIFSFHFPLSAAKRRVQSAYAVRWSIFYKFIAVERRLSAEPKAKEKQRATQSNACLASLIKQKRRTRRGIFAIQIDTNYQK